MTLRSKFVNNIQHRVVSAVIKSRGNTFYTEVLRGFGVSPAGLPHMRFFVRGGCGE
jgi:hypothetical protein